MRPGTTCIIIIVIIQQAAARAHPVLSPRKQREQRRDRTQLLPGLVGREKGLRREDGREDRELRREDRRKDWERRREDRGTDRECRCDCSSVWHPCCRLQERCCRLWRLCFHLRRRCSFAWRQLLRFFADVYGGKADVRVA
eukprot:1831128-Rhodomonas_salina.2